MSEIILSGPHKDFESIKKFDKNGTEFWEARELMSLLGYEKWQNAEDVIGRAAKACINSGQAVDNHFTESSKMVEIGSDTVREVLDWKLDRYACYLIAQNGDPNKPQIALAQTYFAIQTKKQEDFQNLPDSEKRVFIRGEVASQNKNLFRTARESGVSASNFGLFNNAGYEGLYNKSLKEIEKKKGIKKGELLDRAGSTELAANLFRITQTDEKLKKDATNNERAAIDTHRTVGARVRKTIEDIGGTPPEDLPVEKHIREVKKEIKMIRKKEDKKIDK